MTIQQSLRSQVNDGLNLDTLPEQLEIAAARIDYLESQLGVQTATEQQRKDDEATILNRTIEAFLREWRPENRSDAVMFELALINLVRVIHRDAAKPYEKTMESMMKSLSPFIRVQLPGIQK